MPNGIGLRSDPVRAYNFVIVLIDSGSTPALTSAAQLSAILDMALGGFSECTGLEMTLDTHDHEEGGLNGYVRRFPTRVKWSNLTLKRGVGTGSALWDWHYAFTEGKGRRRDGVIMLLNDLRMPNNIWRFRRGLPVRYAGPSLNAQQSSVAIESIEIAHEGLEQIPNVGLAAGAASAAVGMAASAAATLGASVSPGT